MVKILLGSNIQINIYIAGFFWLFLREGGGKRRKGRKRVKGGKG